MCYAKPGNRCFAHHCKKFIAAKYNQIAEHKAIASEIKALGGEKKLTDEQRIDFAARRAEIDRKTRGVSTYYYATESARNILKQTSIPRAERALEEAEVAHREHPRGGTRKTKAAIRNAEAQLALYKRNLAEGERRHHQAATSYATMRRAEAAEKNFDYKAAQYSKVELANANDWDLNKSRSVDSGEFHTRAHVREGVSSGAIPTAGARHRSPTNWRDSGNVDFNQRVRTATRAVHLETPNQERAKALAHVQIVGNRTQGYRVVSNVQSRYGVGEFTEHKDKNDHGTLHERKVGYAAHPALQHEHSRIERSDDGYTYTKAYVHKEESKPMSFDDAKGYATSLVKGESYYNEKTGVKLHSSQLTAGIAVRARAHGLQEHAKANNITAKQQFEQAARNAEANRPAKGWTQKP